MIISLNNCLCINCFCFAKKRNAIMYVYVLIVYENCFCFIKKEMQARKSTLLYIVPVNFEQVQESLYGSMN